MDIRITRVENTWIANANNARGERFLRYSRWPAMAAGLDDRWTAERYLDELVCDASAKRLTYRIDAR